MQVDLDNLADLSQLFLVWSEAYFTAYRKMHGTWNLKLDYLNLDFRLVFRSTLLRKVTNISTRFESAGPRPLRDSIFYSCSSRVMEHGNECPASTRVRPTTAVFRAMWNILDLFHLFFVASLRTSMYCIKIAETSKNMH